MIWHAPHKQHKKNRNRSDKKKGIKLTKLFDLLKKCRKRDCCPLKKNKCTITDKKKDDDIFELFSSVDMSNFKPLEEGDKLFKDPSDYNDLLIINRFGKRSDFLIIEGYKNLVFNSLKQLQNEKGNLEKDSHIYPIMFLFRHYLELIMKHTLRNFRLSNNEISPNEVGYERGHSLLNLWNDVKAYISELENENIEDREYKIFSELINELNEIDNSSFSFRYPYQGVNNINGKITLSIPEPRDISLDNIEEVIYRMSRFIEGLNDLSYAQLDNI
ncbi:hypothetical protein D0T49_11195 [Paludibacter sp. 221]|uniref:hypothetical protein n=1 Tax=Paludibacter sp. 221 TaxID=2302939 RepID=UPI0013D730BA|nr:hypothetical protein [Paludibacter sp. 221]NDV47613.1 hypothetical protein [Paludibacter sp. 221]